MVKALVDIDEHANRILNIVKAKYGLNDKSEAINVMAVCFEEEILEPELRPDFVARLERIKNEKTVRIRDFKKEFGLS